MIWLAVAAWVSRTPLLPSWVTSFTANTRYLPSAVNVGAGVVVSYWLVGTRTVDTKELDKFPALALWLASDNWPVMVSYTMRSLTLGVASTKPVPSFPKAPALLAMNAKYLPLPLQVKVLAATPDELLLPVALLCVTNCNLPVSTL